MSDRADTPSFAARPASVAHRLWQVVAVAVLGVGCGTHREHTPSSDVPIPAQAGFMNANDAPLRWEGRVARDEGQPPRFAWPASGFRFRFRGTGVVARIEDGPLQDVVRDGDLLAVFVDDRPQTTNALRTGMADVVLASGLPNTDHWVRVLKRTESEQGTVVLHALALQGADARFLAAPPERTRRLLAVGDSITAGYGVEGPDQHCRYSARTNNATRTFAFLAAEQLRAEYHAVAWSGRGLYRNLDPSLTETMPVLYGRRLAREATPYEPQGYVPDTVVVNLGTNDFSLPSPDLDQLHAAYVGLLQRIRADAPDAEIVVALGPMLSDYYPPQSMALRRARELVSGVVSQLREAGDTRIAPLEFPPGSPTEGYGCDFHPSQATHRRLAGVLIDHLRARGHWQPAR